MTKQDFSAATAGLKNGDRVRLQLREGCFKASEQFDGSYTGKVFDIGPSMICLAVKREGLRFFNFYPVESIYRVAGANA